MDIMTVFAQIFVSGGSNPYTYNWTPNVTDQSSSNELYAGIYNVQITDNDGCQVYTQIPISTPEELIVFPDEDKEILYWSICYYICFCKWWKWKLLFRLGRIRLRLCILC